MQQHASFGDFASTVMMGVGRETKAIQDGSKVYCDYHHNHHH